MAIALASLSLEGGYFDELHAAPAGSSAALAPAWKTFFDLLGGDGVAHLDRVAETVARQIRDNGVTYNLYADTRQPQRPWSLDLFPLLINAEDWREIEAGAIQRAQLLEAVMADVYGPQSLLAEAMLPPALVHGHPGYLRPMLKVAPVGGSYLHVAAFDLVRGPNGRWSVMSQRTQAPSGLGYLLENRLVISRHFSEAFETMGIQRLAATYRHWVESLKQHSTAGSHAHVALLTPGPYNETYFEHVYLARYLGVTLVEGGDLTVRDERLYLRTLRGLEPVHVLLKRLDDDFLDPLELRADSALGVPGLLQAIRAGHVVLANAPGSAFLESPALLGFLPALCKRLLNESLRLPALDTWWCGERAVLPSVLEQIGRTVIKPTYAGPARNPAFEPVLVSELSAGQRNQWLARIAGSPQHYTLQFRTQASQIPTWVASQKGIVTRPVILRVFALRTSPDTWQVLPGGLARLVGSNAQVATMQRGGSSADVWVQAPSQQAVDRSTLLASSRGRPIAFTPRQRLVTSRAAENLFWFGRYTERCENSARLARLSLEALTGEDQASPSLLAWLQETAERSGLVPKGVPSVKSETRSTTRRRVFARTLIESLDQSEHATSVGFNLRSMRQAASSVRERLATETWQMIDQAIERFSAGATRVMTRPEFSGAQAIQLLDDVSSALAAITGAQSDRMTRDDGWQLLSIGRQLERLGFFAESLHLAVQTGAFDAGADDAAQASAHYSALLSLFDSSITFRAQHQQSRELEPLVSLLVLDEENPRALARVAHALRSRLAKLAKTPMGSPDPIGRLVPDPASWDLLALCSRDGNDRLTTLSKQLESCAATAWQLSDAVSSLYFRHTLRAGMLGV